MLLTVTPGGNRHREAARSAVRVQVLDRVLVAPGAVVVVDRAVADEHAAVAGDVDRLDAHIAVDLLPRVDRGLLLHGGARQRERVAERSRPGRADGREAVRRVVVVVVGGGVLRMDVLALGHVGGAGVLRGIKVVPLDRDALAQRCRKCRRRRRVRVGPAEGARGRIDRSAALQVTLVAIEAGGVRIGAADAEDGRAAAACRLAGTAESLLQRAEAVLHIRHADLLDHAVLDAEHVLRDDGVIRIRVWLPEQLLGTDVAAGRAERVRRILHAVVGSGGVARHIRDRADDDIGAGVGNAAVAFTRNGRRVELAEEDGNAAKKQSAEGQTCLHDVLLLWKRCSVNRDPTARWPKRAVIERYSQVWLKRTECSSFHEDRAAAGCKTVKGPPRSRTFRRARCDLSRPQPKSHPPREAAAGAQS